MLRVSLRILLGHLILLLFQVDLPDIPEGGREGGREGGKDGGRERGKVLEGGKREKIYLH